MTVLFVLALFVIILLVAAGTAVLDNYDRERTERARKEREVHRAERRLHDLASETFMSMLDAARDQCSESHPWQ
jgi:fructoselysine-6-P-deglycase FrlB-like protein